MTQLILALPEISGDLLPVKVSYELIEGPRLRDGYICMIQLIEPASGIYSDFNYDLKEGIKDYEKVSIEEFKYGFKIL